MKRQIQRVTELERNYVLEVLDTQFRTSKGSMMTKRLESEFAEKFNSKYAISFVNGTATMHAALAARGIGPGDEVIVPPLTMSSTSFAVCHAGALPVFADLDPNTWTISPAEIEKNITPRTRAIIPVSIYGMSPDMDGIMDLAARHNLFVLEDDAQCFLGYYKGRVIGSIGHASSFSFQSSKHMTAGEGGMVTTNDDELADGIRRFNSLGYAAVKAGAGKGKITKDTIQDPTYERHASVGFNYRMAELCAAVSLGQLERLEELVEFRKAVARLFLDAAKGTKWFIPQYVPDCVVHSYWTTVFKLDESVPFSWYDFRTKYRELGGDGVYACWQLTHLEPVFKGKRIMDYQWQQFEKGLMPVAESLQPRLFQFKTNYWDMDVAEKQADLLAQTIRYFGG